MLKKLSKRWLIIGAIIGCLLLGAGVAYAAGSLIVDYGSSVGVTGKVIIVAPDPTVDDLEIICPEFTITYGDTTPITGTLRIINGSAYPLTLTNATIIMDNANVGLIALEPTVQGVNDIVYPGGNQDITITISPWNKLASVGEYSYSGTLEYSW